MSCFNSGYGKYDARSGIIQYAEWTDSEGARLLEQLLNGQPVEVGELIPKGSSVDLVVGDGLGRQDFEAPDLQRFPFGGWFPLLSVQHRPASRTAAPP